MRNFFIICHILIAESEKELLIPQIEIEARMKKFLGIVGLVGKVI